MNVVKFVTSDLKSPGGYGILDYSNFGIPIEVESDPTEKGQCSRGINVVPLSDQINFKNVVYSRILILLEINQDDIVFQENNGKMRVKKATPIKILQEQDPEWQTVKNQTDHAFVKSFESNQNNAILIYSDGTKSWYLNGRRHRTDGPAIESSDGTKFWYLNGKFHRTDGPAVERADGSKFWYLNGKLHREDGPAIEKENGSKVYHYSQRIF
jgi:hypothetical protein